MSEPDDVERFNVPLAYIGDLELACDVVFASRYDALAADLAAVRAEIERLNSVVYGLTERCDDAREATNKAIAERDEARSMLADAERDMRQRAAELCENYRHGKQGMAAARAIKWAIVNLPLKHADREGGAE